MSTDLGTWLRTQREERGWSRSETARRLITAARETGDGSMPDAETIRGYIYRWEHGKIHTLSERYVLYYCRAFGIKPAQFGPQPEPAPDARGHPADRRAYRPRRGCRLANLSLTVGWKHPISGSPRSGKRY